MDFHTIISFLLQNWSLSGLFIILLIWLIFEESKAKGPGRQLSAQQVVALMNRDQAYLVDLREPGAYLNTHIIGANNITKVDLSANTNQLPNNDDKKIILVCQRGQTATGAWNQLKKLGFDNAVILKGGMEAWSKANMPVVAHKKGKKS